MGAPLVRQTVRFGSAGGITVWGLVHGWQVRGMECIRRLLRRSGEALRLLQLLQQHHVGRLAQTLDQGQRQQLAQLTFHQLVCSGDGEQIATRLVAALMEVGDALSACSVPLMLVMSGASGDTCGALQCVCVSDESCVMVCSTTWHRMGGAQWTT